MTGFVGTALAHSYLKRNCEVHGISRSDFSKGPAHLSSLVSQSDVVINLAGATILKRWTSRWKKEIFTSRIDSTHAIVEAIKLLPEDQRPDQLLSASAIGFYHEEGDHDEINCQEGKGFLAETCREWENTALKALDDGVVVKVMRFGLILGNTGGAFPRMLKIFKFGFGGRIGSGKQGFPFIHIHDLVDAVQFLVDHPKASGVYNLVAPDKITNNDLTLELGRILKRQTFFRIPAFLLKIVFGEGASVLTKGPFVQPARLLSSGFNFKYPDINRALQDLCGKTI